MSTDFLTVDYDPSLTPAVVDAGPMYATIQWNHAPAGWLLPVERAEEFDATPPAGWERRIVTLGSNKVECYYSPVAEVAILATIKRWFTTDEDGKATYLDHYADGARSKTHALAIVKGSPDLFVLTCKGMSSGDFHSALSKLQGAMKKANAVRPLYFFWLTIQAGEPQRLAKGATVAPLLLGLPGKTDDVLQWLAARFTGAEFVAEVEAGHRETIAEFTKPRTNGHADDEAPAGEAQPPAATNGHAAPPTVTSDDPFNEMKSATADRDVALTLAKTWKGDHEKAVQWALSLGAFADVAEARTDYSWLWNEEKRKNGGPLTQLDAWWPIWIDAVLAMTETVEDPQF